MANDQQRYFLSDLLDLWTNPVYRRHQQNRVLGTDGYRIVGEIIDVTGIGDQNETDNLITTTEFILDCGHTTGNGLGGQCHYCDSLVCRKCIALCPSCGHSVCPQDSLIADFDGQYKRYCRSCAEEMARSMRLRAIGRAVLSLFIPDDRSK